MHKMGPALALLISLSAGFVQLGSAAALPPQTETQTPAEPPAPKPSAAVQQILDDQRNYYRERLQKIRSENREPTASESSELDKSIVEFYDRALALARATGDAAGEAILLENRCPVRSGRERMENPEEAEKAAAPCLEATAAWKRAGDGPGQVRNLADAAHLLVALKPAEAEKLYSQALELGRAETARPLAAAEALRSANWGFLNKPGRLKFLEAALAIQEKSVPGSLAVADTLNAFALAHVDLGNLEASEDYGLRALAIQELLAPESKGIDSTLNHLGIMAIMRGSGATARQYLLRAREVAKKAYLGRAENLGLVNLAVAATLEGDYVLAEDYFRRLLQSEERQAQSARARADPEATARRLAGILKDLGSVALEKGDLQVAKDHLQRALAIQEKYEPDSEYIRGTIAFLEGNLPLAIEHLKRSVGLWEGISADHYALAGYLPKLAEVQRVYGDLDSAEANLRRALAIAEKNAPSGWSMTRVLSGLGWLSADRADWPAARDYFQRALVIQEEILGPNHPEIAETLRGLAKVAAASGAPGEALELALRTEQTVREYLRITASSLPERQALLFASKRVSALDLMLGLVAEKAQPTPEANRRVFDAVIRGRALVLDEMGARHRTISETSDPEVARLAADFAAKQKQWAMLAVRGPERIEQYRSLLEKYERAKEEAERVLAAKSTAFRQEQARSRIGVEEVAAALPPGSALVSFVRHAAHPGSRGIAGSRPPAEADAYSAFVLRNGSSQPLLVPIGAAQDIDLLIARWREQIVREAATPGRSPRRAEALYRRQAAELRRKLWDPLATHLRAARRVFIVADGAISLVNFSAFPVGTRSFLIETGPLIHYLSAERDLVPAESLARGQGLLVVGAPAFDETGHFAALLPEPKKPAGTPQLVASGTFRGNRSACGDFQTMRFDPLPASVQEAERVIALWSRSSGEQTAERRLRGAPPQPARDVLYLRGAEASEAAFKQQAPGKRVLHLATHGFFVGGRCASALVSSPGSSSAGRIPPATAENPLLLAGLVFAGANHRQAAGSDEEDGVLTAEEIAALNLSGVEWAVLSACDTGLGEVRAGEGVFGLRRAFQVAGVRTLVMSLWPVEDDATRQWMNTFYQRRLVQGSSTPEAARDASLELLSAQRARGLSTHPFRWAGFVAAGDWR